MAKGTKTKNKKQVAELPEGVKNRVAAKIEEVEGVASFTRRSDLTQKIREIATWLTSDEPVTDVSDEGTKEAKGLLKKAAEKMLKEAGLREEKKKEQAEGEALGGEESESSSGGNESE
jgi:hypothetical protein